VTPSTEHLGYQPSSTQLPPPGADLVIQPAAAEIETLLTVSWSGSRIVRIVQPMCWSFERQRLRWVIAGCASK